MYAILANRVLSFVRNVVTTLPGVRLAFPIEEKSPPAMICCPRFTFTARSVSLVAAVTRRTSTGTRLNVRGDQSRTTRCCTVAAIASSSIAADSYSRVHSMGSGVPYAEEIASYWIPPGTIALAMDVMR